MKKLRNIIGAALVAICLVVWLGPVASATLEERIKYYKNEIHFYMIDLVGTTASNLLGFKVGTNATCSWAAIRFTNSTSTENWMYIYPKLEGSASSVWLASGNNSTVSDLLYITGTKPDNVD